MKLREYYIYIMMNTANTAIYIGVTNDLMRRAYEHASGAAASFSKKYRLHKLVYYEVCDTAEQAIAREKQLKNWHRDWKLELIRQANPDFSDLNSVLQEIPNQVRNDEVLGADQ